MLHDCSPLSRHTGGSLWRTKPMSTLQRLYGLPNSGASLTARQPKILSHAEGNDFVAYFVPSRGFGIFPLWKVSWRAPSRGCNIFSTLQRLHGLPPTGGSLTTRHRLEPKILSRAEDDNFSPNSYPPEASGYAPSGEYIVELIGHVCTSCFGIFRAVLSLMV